MIKAEYVENTLDDLMSVNAARTSFDKQSYSFDDRDEKLVNYLAREEHWIPHAHQRFTFRSNKPLIDVNLIDEELIAGMVWMKGFKTVRHSFYGWVQLYKAGALKELGILAYLEKKMQVSYHAYGLPEIKAPILMPVDIDDPRFIDVTTRETVPFPIARQKFKHKVGFVESEISRRYVSGMPDIYKVDEWRSTAKNKKQGSAGKHKFNWLLKPVTSIKNAFDKAFYWLLIKSNVCPEQARLMLPQGAMTTYISTGSLTAHSRAYKLRIAEDSQKEIQMLAKQWDEIIRPLYPESWARLTE